MRIAVLIACFNRVQTTLLGISSLKSALSRVNDLAYEIFLLDDASPDMTGDAVRSAFPEVHVITGTGDLYWARGAGKAFEAAQRFRPFDAYLLFNDDVILDDSEVVAFFDDYREANRYGPSILGGATMSKDRSTVTYCGFKNTSKFRPLGGKRVFPDGTLRLMDMPNGNFLLCPGPFFEEIGGLDQAYTMGYADIDLGLTAKQRGVNVFLARRPIGVCDTNPQLETLRKANIADRRKMLDKPIFRVDGYSHFVLKHFPIYFYPVYLAVFFLRRWKLLIRP